MRRRREARHVLLMVFPSERGNVQSWESLTRRTCPLTSVINMGDLLGDGKTLSKKLALVSKTAHCSPFDSVETWVLTQNVAVHLGGRLKK